MNSLTAGVIFVAVWLVVVFAYCIFRACGGRLVDIITCSWLTGPCCSCWGTGGRIHEDDLEYPFRDRPYTPYDPYARGQLPVIVIQNDGRGGADSSSDEEDAKPAENEEQARLRRLRETDPEGRERADGPLLLRNRTKEEKDEEGGPVVV